MQAIVDQLAATVREAAAQHAPLCIRGGGSNQTLYLMDGFNMLNSNTIQSYNSDNRSLATYSQPASIVPPRVFRFGATVNYGF